MSNEAFPVGLVVVAIRPLTPEELQAEDWSGYGVALELSDGTCIYAAQDYERRRPGALVGQLRTGERFDVG